MWAADDAAVQVVASAGMVHQVIYALRGWIAFVAFIDMGMAVQCFLDADSFLGSQLYTAGDIAEHGS